MSHVIIHVDHRAFRAGMTLCVGALLAACGGGGGSTATDTPRVTIAGTASNGSAIASRPVQARCAAGSSSGNTGADGGFTLSIDNPRWPCVARVTLADGSTLHTIAQGTTGTTSATANITPVTELVVARTTGGTPASYYDGFDATAGAALPAAAVATASTAVLTMLKDGGVTVPAEPVTGALTTAAAQALVDLAKAMALSGATLVEVTNSVANTTSTVASSGTPTLPTASLLQPGAAGCVALRSGAYVVFDLSPGNDPPSTITIDASTLTVTESDRTSTALTASGSCRFAVAGRLDLVVSPAGVIVVRTLDSDGTSRMALAVPKQTHALADRAGTWNAALLSAVVGGDSSAYRATTVTTTIDAAGVFGQSVLCGDVTSWVLSGSGCRTVATGLPVLRSQADGTVGIVFPGDTDTVSASRLAMYQAGSGDAMLIETNGDGTFGLYTRKRTNTLPAVGTQTKSWNVTLNAQSRVASAIGDSSNTIASVDAIANSWVRTQHPAAGPAFDYPETLWLNSPRDGYTTRPAVSSTAVNGSSVDVPGFHALGMRGMGFSALAIPSNRTFVLSVTQP